MSEWQPIETAPYSVRILLCWKGTEHLSAHVELGRRSRRDGYVNTYGHPFNGTHGNSFNCNPDYWMPLPPPPDKTQEEK